MKKSIKAALFSGLLFPGTGHFSLKLYMRGMIFFVPALLCLLYLGNSFMQEAYTLADQISLGNVPLDPDAIANLLNNPGSREAQFKMQVTIWIMIACWIISVIDAFRLGYIADQKEKK
jgi:hypothetical protein